MRFIGPRSHLEEEHPVDMVALNLSSRNRKDAGPLGELREQYEQVRGKARFFKYYLSRYFWAFLATFIAKICLSFGF